MFTDHSSLPEVFLLPILLIAFHKAFAGKRCFCPLYLYVARCDRDPKLPCWPVAVCWECIPHVFSLPPPLSRAASPVSNLSVSRAWAVYTTACCVVTAYRATVAAGTIFSPQRVHSRGNGYNQVNRILHTCSDDKCCLKTTPPRPVIGGELFSCARLVAGARQWCEHFFSRYF